MQVQAINTYNNQPSFKAIKYQKGLLNNKNRRDICNYITRRLNEVDPNDRLKRSFVERAERDGYDILFTKGKKNNSVRVDIVTQLSQEKASVYNGIPLNNRTHVGTYSCHELFNLYDFSKAYKPSTKMTKFYNGFMTGLLGVLFITAVGEIGYAIKKDLTSVERKPNTTIVAKDSLKTDSIKPNLEDSFKLGKKFIKK